MAATWRTAMFAELATPIASMADAAATKAYERLGIVTLGDLLRHVPRHLMSGTDLTDIARLTQESAGQYVALVAEVDSMEIKGAAPRQRLELTLTDGRSKLEATFFGKPQYISYWKQLASRSRRGVFAGKLGMFMNSPQLTHPAFAMITPDGLVGTDANKEIAETVSTGSFIGMYPASAAVPTWTIARAALVALELVADLPDPMPAWVRERAGVMEFTAALRAVHAPVERDEHERGKRRLVFDEAFATQATMAYRRADTSRHTAIARRRLPHGLVTAFDEGLPFTLTAEQRAVGEELTVELDRTRPMQRLLQGEVGSGKTVVALRAMLTVVDAGGQAALIAPTEVLAHQHARTVASLLGTLGQGPLIGGPQATEVVLLTGSMPAAQKKAAREAIASGRAGIVIGTHALLSDQVAFADLGLVVIDEQHRFGVEQRAALQSRARHHPHVLVMTATPIPRSVAMTVFGDLDVSTLTEIPAGRPQVSTTVVDQVKRPAWVARAWARVAEEVALGRQAFVVAPRISRTDPTGDGEPAASVTQVYEELTAGPLRGLRVEALHGRLPTAVKDQTMEDFVQGRIDVLVATTMIEVGVDVPNATMMVICDADRFGISQLHQLRGRVGRGRAGGVCLLLTSAPWETPARERLEQVAATTDGFVLAEADLAQRREGDVLGMSQSGGRSSLRLLRVLEDREDIELARTLAEEAVRRDPDLGDPGVADYVRQVDLMAQADISEAT